MRLSLKVFLFFIVLACGQYGFGQKVSKEDQKKIDSIKQLDYKEIYSSFLKVVNDSSQAIIFAYAYLEKGKKEKDTIRICNGFTQISYFSSHENALKYSDSIILFTKNLSHYRYPALGYINKGTELYFTGKYKEALDNFLIAKNHVNKNENKGLELEIKEAIGSLKNIGGDYKGALKESKEILEIEREKLALDSSSIENYLIALHNLSLDYLRINEPDSSLTLINEGISLSLKINDSLAYYDYIGNAGLAYYFRKDFQKALDSLDKAFPFRIDQNARINYYLYKGKIAKDIGNLEKAISHFEKLDSIYEMHQVPVRELPEVYQTFIDYYKAKGDIENQLKYINKFIAVDSVLDANFNYLSTNITKEYDIPLLVSEKENLISRLKNEKRTTNLGLGISIGVGLLLAVGFIYYYRKQRFYKRRFEEILSTKPSSKPQIPSSKSLKGISEEVIEQIQKGLDHFESQKEFLDGSITLNSLSKTLSTNSNYLSKVINFNKQKNFSNYLNDLRIEYAIEQLKNNPQFRKYSVKGMAQEVGFNSPESFSKAFYKRSGLYPSYFLKQLEKMN